MRISGARTDRWRAIPGETRWVDYSGQQVGEDLVVYVHTFRRIRERYDADADVLLWKPGTTGVAQRYAAGAWLEVVDVERAWPPTDLVRIPRRERTIPRRDRARWRSG